MKKVVKNVDDLVENFSELTLSAYDTIGASRFSRLLAVTDVHTEVQTYTIYDIITPLGYRIKTD